MRFIGVAGQDEVSEMKGFVDEHGLTGFEHLADQGGSIWRGFEITAQPSFVFINDNGEIQRQIGALEMDDLVQALDQLIAN